VCQRAGGYLDVDARDLLPPALHHALEADSSVLNVRVKRIVHELRPTALDADATSLLARSVALPCWYGGGTTSTMMNLLLSGYSSSRRLACAATLALVHRQTSRPHLHDVELGQRHRRELDG
jgi:hypothetical protein